MRERRNRDKWRERLATGRRGGGGGGEEVVQRDLNSAMEIKGDRNIVGEGNVFLLLLSFSLPVFSISLY